MKRYLSIRSGILLFTATAFACNTTTTTVTAKNVTQPVLLGPVRYIKGDKPQALAKKDEFDIKVEQSVQSRKTGRYSSTTDIVQEGEEKIDAELLKKAEGPADKIAVDKVYVSSSITCYLVFCNGWVDYSGIEGGIYGKDAAARGKK